MSMYQEDLLAALDNIIERKLRKLRDEVDQLAKLVEGGEIGSQAEIASRLAIQNDRFSEKLARLGDEIAAISQHVTALEKRDIVG